MRLMGEGRGESEYMLDGAEVIFWGKICLCLDLKENIILDLLTVRCWTCLM